MGWENSVSELGWIPISIVFIATLISGITDLWKYRVYNAVTIPLLFGGFFYHSIVSGWSGLVSSSVGLLFGFAVLLLPHLLGLMGAGDVKLMAGIGAWFGFAATASVFAVTALVSGSIAVFLIVRRGEFQESWSTLKMIFTSLILVPTHIGKNDLVSVVASGHDRRLRAIPFAAIVPIGVVLTLVCNIGGVL